MGCQRGYNCVTARGLFFQRAQNLLIVELPREVKGCKIEGSSLFRGVKMRFKLSCQWGTFVHVFGVICSEGVK